MSKGVDHMPENMVRGKTTAPASCGGSKANPDAAGGGAGPALQRTHRWARSLCLGKSSLCKMLVDAVIVSAACLFVFEILPRNAAFFELASAHTTLPQKTIHAAAALACVVSFRLVMRVYRQSWSNAKTLRFLRIMAADVAAGVAYYVITEYAMGSVYPFLLTLSLFALIDIGTLFLRLLCKGLSEEYGMTEQ